MGTEDLAHFAIDDELHEASGVFGCHRLTGRDKRKFSDTNPVAPSGAGHGFGQPDRGDLRLRVDTSGQAREVQRWAFDSGNMLDRGDASKEDIDAAMQFGCGHPMGPITLTDYVGLDTTLYILQGWVERFPDEPAFEIPKILEQKVAEGKLGRKTGEGFYKWDGDKKVE